MANKILHTTRLPEHIVPTHYKVLLTPDFDNFTFVGEEVITLDVKKSSKEIKLHSAELEILSAEVTFDSKTEVGKVSYDDRAETAAISFPKEVDVGVAKLKLEFTGILNDKMRGFYRSSYEVDGVENHMVVTQFESTDARRAIPCFDEPSKKAVFEVSLIVPSDRTVISNTIDHEVKEHATGLKLVNFAPTPKMSTYLLALIVGHFEHIETKSAGGVLVRVFVTPGKKRQAKFALSTASKIVDFFEKYFDIPYPLPTLDLVAIPDFASGAMENWGAITYRENALLVDPEKSSSLNRQWVALVIAHEIAHQWFGNLVTMEWWTHLWLNEGFASYMEYFVVDHLFPEWDIWSQFVQVEQSSALDQDALVSTHPIEVEVHHPKEIVEIFDAVSYSKGASIIRMIAEYLGEETFRNGLREYLKHHSYSNAATEDLWDALEKVSGKPVRKIMDFWVKKPGYPLITLEEDGKNYKLSQKRFFSSEITATHEKDTTKWSVPISIITSSATRPKFYFLEGETLTIPKGKSDKWVKADVSETSFVRVYYNSRLLRELTAYLARQEGTLAEVDKFGVIRDAFALAEAGKLSTDAALALAEALKKDTSYIVWAQIISQIKRLGNLLADKPYYEKFRAFSRDLLSDIVQKVGWEKDPGEPHTRTLLRSAVLYAAGSNGDQQTIERARALFKKSNQGLLLDPDLRGTVFALFCQSGASAEHDLFINMYKSETLSEEKNRIMRALTEFSDPALLKKSLHFSFSKYVRSQDVFRGVELLMFNPIARRFTWDYEKRHWKEIADRFEGVHILPRFIIGASNFATSGEAAEVEDFFADKTTGDIKRTIAQTVEQIRSNAAWLARDSQKISSFLERSRQF